MFLRPTQHRYASLPYVGIEIELSVELGRDRGRLELSDTQTYIRYCEKIGERTMILNSLQDIERAIAQLKPEQLAGLHAWLRSHRPVRPADASVFEQGLGLFGSAEDAALLDEVVQMAYEERRRPSSSDAAL